MSFWSYYAFAKLFHHPYEPSQQKKNNIFNF